MRLCGGSIWKRARLAGAARRAAGAAIGERGEDLFRQRRR
jgi:hypothetical protein